MPRRAPLAMDPETFRAAGHALVDQLAELLASVPERPVTPGEAPSEVRAALDADASLPETGMPADTLLRSTAELLFDHSLFNGHPRFFGYITSAPAPIGMFGDFLAAAVNANVGGWMLSPMASEIEAQTVRWIAELLGYPRDAGGVLVSGGNMANLVAFWAARAAVADWDIRKEGAAPDAGGGALRVYGSAETHTWIEKATDLAGLGTDAMRWVETDGRQRMRVDALRAALERDIEAGDRPMMVVGTAGSVSTGAVDPLPEVAALCQELGVWFHVDGAYGGLAVAAPDTPAELAALRHADSVAVDPHKWLYAPLEAGCALVRDADRLRNAFAYHPPYYHFEERATNFVDYGPQNSRGFRALKVWLALRQVGREGYARMIGDDIRLCRRLYAAAEAHPELEALTRSLSIATFRYVPTELRDGVGSDTVDAYLDDLNRALLERLERSGDAFVSNAVIDGRFVLRACIVNFNTDEADVDALPEITARHGRAAHAALGGPAARTGRASS